MIPLTEKEMRDLEFHCKYEMAKEIYGEDRISNSSDHIWIKSTIGAGHYTFDPLQHAYHHEQVLLWLQKNTKYSAGKEAIVLNMAAQLRYQNELVKVQVERTINQDGMGPAYLHDVYNYDSVAEMREGHLKLAISLVMFLCMNDMIDNRYIKSTAMRNER